MLSSTHMNTKGMTTHKEFSEELMRDPEFKKIDEIEDQVKQEKKDFKEAKGAKYVKRDAVKKIIAAWVITVPASALIAAGIYYMIKGIVAV